MVSSRGSAMLIRLSATNDAGKSGLSRAARPTFAQNSIWPWTVRNSALAAAELYGELMARNRGVMGLPRIHPHSAAGLMLDEGIFGQSTNVHEPEFVERVRRRAAAAILMVRTSDGDAPASTGRKPSALVHAVACYDTDAAAWSRADLQNLCHGLDALVGLFRVRRDSS